MLGGVVLVRCEHAATRQYLGNRCVGHGVTGRITRWTSLVNVDCHGKWLRRQPETAAAESLEQCSQEALLIFV